MSNFRHKIITFFTFIGGAYFFLEYVIPKEAGINVGKYHEQISTAVQLVGVMAIGLGIINIFRVHGSNILKSKPGWFNSLALIAGLVTVLALQWIDFRTAESRSGIIADLSNQIVFVKRVAEDFSTKKIDPIPRLDAQIAHLQKYKRAVDKQEGLFAGNTTETAPYLESINDELDIATSRIEDFKIVLAKGEQYAGQLDKVVVAIKALSATVHELTEMNYEATTARTASNFIFNSFFVPLGSAMFSLLAFYIVTAAYRSFRIKSLEAAVMMIPALIVMLGQIPHGIIYFGDWMPELRLWLLKYLNASAFRAIFFGSAIAGLAMAIRMWFSLERSPLMDDQDAEVK